MPTATPERIGQTHGPTFNPSGHCPRFSSFQNSPIGHRLTLPDPLPIRPVINQPGLTYKRIKMVLITRGISLTNFLVASSALAFQVFVLYPWHKQLDESFEDLKKEHLKVLQVLDRVEHGKTGGSGGSIREQIELKRQGL
ncbi:hypothetical protein BDV35DRAFT_382774 [Aspergillus flavus]|uniref:Mitochondrial phosphate carrier protein n=1 Tax=Aspergillus flavus TaxID=5059 RepID=A0A5N6GSG6_ASPFL|nr:hypothetical protein BDV35DRAFT_382774 [Aspergillus flavus]